MEQCSISYQTNVFPYPSPPNLITQDVTKPKSNNNIVNNMHFRSVGQPLLMSLFTSQ